MVHQADKGYVSEFHYGLAHKPTSIKEVMNLPEANAAVDKEWDWDIKQVKSKAEVAVHFASRRGLCIWKHAGLATHFHKNKGRVVLPGENANTTTDTM